MNEHDLVCLLWVNENAGFTEDGAIHIREFIEQEEHSHIQTSLKRPFTKQEEKLYNASFDIWRDGENIYYGWHSKKNWAKLLGMTDEDFNDFLGFFYMPTSEYAPSQPEDYQLCSSDLTSLTVDLIEFLERNTKSIVAYFNASAWFLGHERFPPNHQLIYDTTPALSWKGHGFRSPQEVEMARALDRAGVLFFPNAGCRVTDESKQRVTREVDFLVVVDGIAGILECDSMAYHDSERDKVRDANFNRQGILFIKRYPWKLCLEPDKVVEHFIRNIKRWKANPRQCIYTEVTTLDANLFDDLAGC